MFTDSQQDALVTLLSQMGVEGLVKDKIKTSTSRYASVAIFMTKTDFQKKLAGIPELVPLLAQIITDKPSFENELYGVIQAMTPKKPKSHLGDTAGFKDIMLDPDDYYPIVLQNMPPEDCIALVHKGDRRLSTSEEFHPDIWMIKKSMTREEVINSDTPIVVPIFNPRMTDFIYAEQGESGKEMLYLNTYVPPAWRKLNAEPRYHGFIKDLMEHLFPKKEDREFVLDWLHYAVVGKNGTMLCLVGPKGTGKTLLLGDICQALVGTQFHGLGTQALLMKEFNKVFDKKRFVFLDEVDLREEEAATKIRTFCNDRITVEKKGQDPFEIVNHSSLALASNSLGAFKVEADDRRFSVPEVTSINLAKVKSRQDIAAFKEEIKNSRSQVIAEFGEWLIQRVPIYTSEEPYKGPLFYELCRRSLAQWQQFLVDFLANAASPDDIFSLEKIKKAYNKSNGGGGFQPNGGGEKFIAKKKGISDFFSKHREGLDGEYRVGQIIDFEDDNGRVAWGVKPDKDFWEYSNSKKVKAEDLL